MPNPAIASHTLKHTHDFFDFHEAFLVFKAVIFNDSLDFFKSSIAFHFHYLLCIQFKIRENNLRLLIFQ